MFLPSIFVWTSLGLRESYVYLWLEITWSASRALSYKSSKQDRFSLFVRIQGFAFTKLYLFALVLTTSIVVIQILSKKFGFPCTFSVMLLFTLPLVFDPGMSKEFVSGAGSVIRTGSTGNTNLSAGLTLRLLILQLIVNLLLMSTLNRLGLMEYLVNASKNTVSESGVKTKTTGLVSGSFNEEASFLMATANFLVLPIPFIDKESFFYHSTIY